MSVQWMTGGKRRMHAARLVSIANRLYSYNRHVRERESRKIYRPVRSAKKAVVSLKQKLAKSARTVRCSKKMLVLHPCGLAEVVLCQPA